MYGFVFALSLSLFVGEELAPPVAPNLSIPATFAKEHLSLAFLATPIAPNLSILATIAKGQQPFAPHHHTRLMTVFSLQKQLYPFSRLFNRSNLFCTFLTSPSTRAILLLALAKTN